MDFEQANVVVPAVLPMTPLYKYIFIKIYPSVGADADLLSPSSA